MISFYPGPSRVHTEVPAYVRDAYDEGILSINHRSDEFVQMCERTIGLLKERLNVPKDYTIFFTGSATECWEIIAQSLITDKSYHIYNGAFGQKWFDYTKRLYPLAVPLPFGIDEALDPKRLIFEQREGLICITQNETSNGTQVANELIHTIKQANSSYLVAVDATSSMAGVMLDFSAADIWLASVQKCFGLPAGLGLLICSPTALQRAAAIGEKSHYNSLIFLAEMMSKWQTSHTPNVLAIYLLMRVLEKCPPISQVHAETVRRFQDWSAFLESSKLQHLVTNPAVHSFTVLPLTATQELISDIKRKAKTAGLLLGEGYGQWKASSFRIANFPAIESSEIEVLKAFLKDI